MPPSLEIDCVTAGHAISEHFAIQTLVGTREPMFASTVARKWLVAFVSLLRRYLWNPLEYIVLGYFHAAV